MGGKKSSKVVKFVPVSDGNSLLDRFNRANPVAIKEAYFEYYQRLYNYGLIITREEEVVKDCIQQIFVNIISHRSQTDPINNIKAYLLSALRREILRELKKLRKNVDADDHKLEQVFSAESMIIAEEDRDSKLVKLQIGISQLSDRQKEAIYLKFHQNLSYDEISVHLNINYQSCRSLIYKAIQSLRKKMS